MFAYPALLWFLPILVAVILIHLINMFRHRRVEWGAMEFILVSFKKSRTRILLQQLLLILLRMLAVAAVILMFAGPTLEGELAQWFGDSGTHHIILLDDSYSMNERNLAQGGSPLFDDALAVIQKIADGKRHDRLTLLTLSSSNPVLHELPLTADNQQTVSNVLQKLQPSSFAHDPEKMLLVGSDLARQTVGLKPVVYFLSDFRRRNWENPEPMLKQIETIRQQGGTVRMVRAAQTEQPNLCLEQVVLADGIHAADIDILLDATVANYAMTAAENVLVMLFVDDQIRLQQTIPRLPPGGKTVPPLRFPVRVDGQTAHRVEVRLQPDALPDDNHRYLVLHVPAALEVLLIAPSLPPGTESASQYVRIALAPGGAHSGIRVRQEQPSYLAEKPLEQFSAIFIVDLPAMEPSAVKALENYVTNGGGAAFFPGENTDIEFVRSQLYKNGAGLFPAAPTIVQELLPDFLTKATDIRVSPHPVFRLFSDGDSPLLGSVVVDRYLAVEQVVEPAINVWAALRNGAPLVLEKTFGSGKTMTFLTSASPAWNNWGRNPSFVVVMLELTAWLSKRAEQSQTFLVGDPLTVTINPMEFEERVQFGLPPREGESSGSVTIETIPDNDGLLAATFPQLERPGFYTVGRRSRSGGEVSELKAVNVTASEGDIRQLDVTEASDILRAIRQPLETAAGFTAVTDFGGQQSMSDWLLYAAILLLLGEIFLAGRILPPNPR